MSGKTWWDTIKGWFNTALSYWWVLAIVLALYLVGAFSVVGLGQPSFAKSLGVPNLLGGAERSMMGESVQTL